MNRRVSASMLFVEDINRSLDDAIEIVIRG
jgi:hypothetical protein